MPGGDDDDGDDDGDDEAGGTYASPPCFMHELDPSYLGLPPKVKKPAPERTPERTDGKEDEAAGDQALPATAIPPR
jgi:hypothetical protein